MNPTASARRRVQAGVRGFTMVELITVMVVMGILAAIGAARFFDRSNSDPRIYADQAKAMIRYGQKLAIAQNRRIFVRADGNSFALCTAPSCAATELIAPAAGGNSGSSDSRSRCTVASVYVANWACEGRPATVTVTATRATEVGAGGFFSFDASGRPFNAADGSGVTSTFGLLSITMAAGSTSSTIVIEQETGYVH